MSKTTQKPITISGAILDPSGHTPVNGGAGHSGIQAADSADTSGLPVAPTNSADTKREAERKRFQAQIAKLAKDYDKVSRQHERLFGRPLPPPPAPEAVQAMQRMKRPKLTPKQSRLIENLAGGATITDAAIEAGYSASSRMTAGQLGSQALESIRRKMPEVLAAHGLTDDALVEKLKSLVNAKETKFFQKDGKVVETREVEALGIQAQALDMALNVRGAYPQRGGDGVSVGTVNILWAGNVPKWAQPDAPPSPQPYTIEADRLPWAKPDGDTLTERVDNNNSSKKV